MGASDVRDAEIEEPTDVVLRITSSALCGTDLHMYDGRTGAEPGLILGHEPLGVVEATGSAVELVKEGDRVVVPTHLFCGLCFNCVRGYSAACLRVRPGSFGAAYGYAGMGPYRGAQAELLRVPYADANCIQLPGEPGDEYEDDFVMLAGCIGIAGVYAEKDLALAPEGSADGRLGVPWSTLFTKGIGVRFGRTHDRRYTTRLRDLVVARRARPGKVVTHHPRLEDAAQVYDQFDRRAGGIVKVVFRVG